jgi:hypothetical protein
MRDFAMVMLMQSYEMVGKKDESLAVARDALGLYPGSDFRQQFQARLLRGGTSQPAAAPALPAAPAVPPPAVPSPAVTPPPAPAAVPPTAAAAQPPPAGVAPRPTVVAQPVVPAPAGSSAPKPAAAPPVYTPLFAPGQPAR